MKDCVSIIGPIGSLFSGPVQDICSSLRSLKFIQTNSEAEAFLPEVNWKKVNSVARRAQLTKVKMNKLALKWEGWQSEDVSEKMEDAEKEVEESEHDNEEIFPFLREKGPPLIPKSVSTLYGAMKRDSNRV